MAARASFLPPAPPDAADGFDVTGPPRLHGVPFSGRARFTTLSHLGAAHSSGGGLFGFMTMRESNKVRAQSREAREAVMAFAWAEGAGADDSRVAGDVAAWRRAFPAARAVDVSGRADLRDADFARLRGAPGARLDAVRMARCRGVTDAAFVHLRGVDTLDRAAPLAASRFRLTACARESAGA